jgi:hypothetical protein
MARTYDVFLALRSARLCVGQLRAVGIDATARTVGVDLYYRSDTDVVLLGLRLDPRTATHTLLDRIRAEAAVAGAAVLEPARLDELDRERFYEEHLALYPLRVTSFPTVADAVRKLAGDLGFRLETPPPAGASNVDVRFRAGDRWQLGRARSLSREGIYVFAGSGPRVGETVTLRLAAGDSHLTVRAAVVHVTPEDAAVTVGGTGFAARFILGTQAERAALEGLVVAGRSDGLGALRPAPSRREARYPVRWPITIDGREHPFSALDVSRHGMFVATSEALEGPALEVAVSPDDGGEAMRARARVARTLDDEAASARGVTAGCGLELSEFAPGDGERFGHFVHRVGQRAARRLLVGAAQARQRALVAPLSAAGYVVSAAGDPAEVLAGAEAVDLVFLDPSLASRDHEVRRALAARRITAFALEPGQHGRTLRSLADAALLS